MGKYVILPRNMGSMEIEEYEEDNQYVCIQANDMGHARHQFVDFQFEFSSRYKVKMAILEQFVRWYDGGDLEELNDFDMNSEIMERIHRYSVNENTDYEEEKTLANDLFEQLSQEDAKTLYFDACAKDYYVVEVVDFEEYMDREIANLRSLIPEITIYEIITYNIVSNMIRNGCNEFAITTAELLQYGLDKAEITSYISYISTGRLRNIIHIQYEDGNFSTIALCRHINVEASSTEKFQLKITPGKELIELAMSGYDFREGKTIEAVKILEQCR